jgi:hypothetical protein
VEETTGETPPALLNRPVLTTWVQEYWRAYLLLESSRQLSMSGAGPIPISEILAYVTLLEIDGIEEREKYVIMVSAMDAVYLEHMQAKQQAEKGKRRG